MTTFAIECFQNEFLAQGADTMHAVLTVTASGTGAAGAGGVVAEDRTELLIVDTSGSMKGANLRAATRATSAAVDCLPDGVSFGIVSGNHEAALIYPLAGSLAVSSAKTRQEAKEATKSLEAMGGTAIGTWIRLATDVLRARPGIRHAILLTDGKNESEGPEDFEAALGDALGVFECDCRGVGTNWIVSELRTVATALLGTCDLVADPENLELDFSTMMAQSLRKQVAAVALRIWMPKGAQLLDLTQLQEEEAPLPLTGTRVVVDDLTSEYGTGSWEDESRDFYLGLRVPLGEVGEERLGARVSLVVDGETAGQALVRTIWTDDTVKSTPVNRRVARAMNEEELAVLIQDVVDSHRAGDLRQATDRAEDAWRMADAEGNEGVKERIATMFDEDPLTGRLRPKSKVDEAVLMDFEVNSTKTTSRAARTREE
jgi:von Willebrand factor type A domain